VAGLCAIDVERAGERVVARSHVERVARFADGVAEAVEGIGVENVAGLQVGDRLGGRVDVFYVGGWGLGFDDIAGLGVGEDRESSGEKETFKRMMPGNAHGCFSKFEMKLTSAAKAGRFHEGLNAAVNRCATQRRH